MDTSISGDIAILRDLNDKCSTTCNHFEHAARTVSDSALKGIILEVASKLKEFSDELEAESLTRGAPTQPSTSPSLMDVFQSAVGEALGVSTDSTNSLTDELERLEQQYEAGSRNAHDPGSKTLLIRHVHWLREARRRIDALLQP